MPAQQKVAWLALYAVAYEIRSSLQGGIACENQVSSLFVTTTCVSSSQLVLIPRYINGMRLLPAVVFARKQSRVIL